ncbi:MAG: YaiI/YqxD family protein [Gammaproteobacteria bacterium]|nr:YaiI/YqxD family protein [Gammaproteobacteria bacterium]
MHIWVDADACPGAIKDVVFRAANRCRVVTTLFANHYVRVPKSPYLRSVQVEHGFDVADQRIVASLSPGDLVITSDIPLAAQVVDERCVALNPRGTLYTADNVKEHLTRRDLMEELRASGAVSGGPPALSKSNVQAFANQLDAYLARHVGDNTEAAPP